MSGMLILPLWLTSSNTWPNLAKYNKARLLQPNQASQATTHYILRSKVTTGDQEIIFKRALLPHILDPSLRQYTTEITTIQFLLITTSKQINFPHFNLSESHQQSPSTPWSLWRIPFASE